MAMVWVNKTKSVDGRCRQDDTKMVNGRLAWKTRPDTTTRWREDSKEMQAGGKDDHV